MELKPVCRILIFVSHLPWISWLKFVTIYQLPESLSQHTTVLPKSKIDLILNTYDRNVGNPETALRQLEERMRMREAEREAQRKETEKTELMKKKEYDMEILLRREKESQAEENARESRQRINQRSRTATTVILTCAAIFTFAIFGCALFAVLSRNSYNSESPSVDIPPENTTQGQSGFLPIGGQTQSTLPSAPNEDYLNFINLDQPPPYNEVVHPP